MSENIIRQTFNGVKSIKYYLEKAQKEGWAIGQFNFSTLEQFHGIVQAAKILNSPVILGTSEGESKFFGLEEAIALRNVFRKEAGLPVFLNLDHGKSFSAKGGPPPEADAPLKQASGWEYIRRAIDAGYDMVHFDGSKLPLEENIKITKQVKNYAKWRGVLVEGEVGTIGTDSSTIYSGKFEIKEENLTKPEDAEKFLKETGADLLAPSFGNFHGVEISGACPSLRLDVLRFVKEKSRDVFLVLHGGSGISEEDIKGAIKLGIAKININTELRAAFSENLRKSLQENPSEIVPYKFLVKPLKSVADLVKQKINLFGSENKN